MYVAKVLVVDDEADFRATVRRGLERKGYAVEEAGDGAEALTRLRGVPYDLVIVDLYMPGMSGLAVLESLHHAGERVPPAIVITGLGDWGSYAKALDMGVKAFLCKPLALADLTQEVARVLAPAAGAGAPEAPRRKGC